MSSYNLSGVSKPEPIISQYKNGKKKVTMPRLTKSKLPTMITSKNAEELTGTKYEWKNKKLQKLKKELNKVKSHLDTIQSSKKSARLYRAIVYQGGFYEDLRGNGIIAEDYGAEVATNAWLKFWEICEKYLKPILTYHNKKNPNFKSFHVAEAPGNFIICLNHYLSQFNIEWDWRAESYVENENLGTLGDDYGLIKKTKKHWVLGIEENGDICSSANIRSFVHSFNTDFTPVSLYTGDGKLETHDHNEEELYNLRLLYGQVFGCFATLAIGGTCVIKAFSTFEAPTISLLYLMQLSFWELHIFKPYTSRGANSEMYIIGKDYRGITPSNLKKLLNWFDDIDDVVIKQFSLFKEEDIPSEFIKKIEIMAKDRVTRQVKYLNRNYSLYESYRENPDITSISSDMAEIRAETSKKWLKKYNMFGLDMDNLIL